MLQVQASPPCLRNKSGTGYLALFLFLPACCLIFFFFNFLIHKSKESKSSDALGMSQNWPELVGACVPYQRLALDFTVPSQQRVGHHN